MGRRLLPTVPVLLLVAASLALGPASQSSAATTVSHAPRVPGTTSWTGPVPSGPVPSGPLHTNLLPVRRAWTSPNWSGYAVSGTGFHSVVGNWTVPTVLAPLKPRQVHRNQFSGTWVGIDGFSDGDLIQAGTEEDWLHGTAFYQAWWEILPAAETPIPTSIVAVHPGDSITVSITRGSPRWIITLTNNTTHQTFTTHQGYAGPMTSAEWVHEAVSVGGRISRLPRDSTFSFDSGLVNGAPAFLVPSEAGAIVQQGVRVSTPSAPDSDHDGFTVAYGSAIPHPPTS